jgi:hypothetical protein
MPHYTRVWSSFGTFFQTFEWPSHSGFLKVNEGYLCPKRGVSSQYNPYCVITNRKKSTYLLFLFRLRTTYFVNNRLQTKRLSNFCIYLQELRLLQAWNTRLRTALSEVETERTSQKKFVSQSVSQPIFFKNPEWDGHSKVWKKVSKREQTLVQSLY